MTATADPLSSTLEHAHSKATQALDGDGRERLDAVGWLSAHLAAMDRVLLPEVERHLPDGRRRAAAARSLAHRLHETLWMVDHRLTGDARTDRVPVASVMLRLREDLDRHALAEHTLVDALAGVLDDEAVAQLAGRLRRATEQAPTRPHPMTPHRRGTRTFTFWVASLVDRWRDMLDSRHTPTRRPRRIPRPPGRWGAYLLGGQVPPRRDD